MYPVLFGIYDVVTHEFNRVQVIDCISVHHCVLNVIVFTDISQFCSSSLNLYHVLHHHFAYNVILSHVDIIKFVVTLVHSSNHGVVYHHSNIDPVLVGFDNTVQLSYHLDVDDTFGVYSHPFDSKVKVKEPESLKQRRENPPARLLQFCGLSVEEFARR